MACKLVVLRFTSGLDHIGDVVNAYPYEMYLGDLVEPQGGAFVIIEVNDCNEDNEVIQSLLEPNLSPTTHNRIKGLKPVKEGDEFFTELLTNGRINVTLDKLQEYIVTHGS